MTVSYRQLFTVLHDLDIIPESVLHGTVEQLSEPDAILKTNDEVADALEHHGTLFNIYDDDDMDTDDYYEWLLEGACAHAGDRVTITDIRVVEDDGDSEDERWDTLEFNRDGERVSFTVRHNEYAHYDHETASEIIDHTVHRDDPRLWQEVRGHPDLIGQLFVLFTPDQAEGFNQRIAPLINCRRPVTPPAP